MAKVKKFGEAVVLTSGVKLEDFQKVGKYRPAALTLFGGEDGKEPLFSVGFSSRRGGSISEFGVEFGGASEDGYAQVTVAYAGPPTDVKKALADSIGPQVMMLNKIEAGIPAILEEIDAEIGTIMESIELG